MKTILRRVSTLWAACPYTMLGKKTIRTIRRGSAPVVPVSDRERHLESQIRIG
jgi:hypothetical protein